MDSNFWDWLQRAAWAMAIVPEKRWAYLRIPKTGQTTVYRFMVQYKGKEKPLDLTENGGDYFRWLVRSMFSKAEWDTYESWAMVRDPWDRAVSWWAYLFKDKIPFKEFIMSDLWKTSDYGVWIHGQPCSYFTHYNGEQMVKNILRFEGFDEAATKIVQSLGIADPCVSIQNNSQRGPYMEYYDDETKEKVSQMYRDDIELFGYEFGKAKSATTRSF